MVCTRAGGYTCIAYRVEGKGEDAHIHSVEMAAPELLNCCNHAPQFEGVWTAVPGYDVMKAAKVYLNSHMVISDEVDSILRRIAKMETQSAAPAAKKATAPVVKKVAAAKPDLKKAAAPLPKNPPVAAAKKEVGAAKKSKIAETAVITKLKGTESKKFQEGSVRHQIWLKIKDGITVKELVKACSKFCEEKVVLVNLSILAEPDQKQPGISIK